MNIYNFMFVWIGMMAIFQWFGNTEQMSINADGTKSKRWTVLWSIVAVLPIIYVAAFTSPRSDTVLYVTLYNRLVPTFGNFVNVIVSHESGWGFVAFEILIKILSGSSVPAFRFILALCHTLPIVFITRKYSDNYIFSIFLFLAGGYHIAWMMNGLRQFLAASLIFAATPWIVEKKYIPAVITILIASTIHSSCIIMIPVIFIAQGDPWNKRTLLFLALMIFATYYFNNNIEGLNTLLQGTEYSGALDSAAQMGDDGANPIRVLVNAIPMLLAFFGRKHIAYEKNDMINLCVNMSVITTGMYLVAMVTSGVMVGRIPVYTSMYSLILLPCIIPKIFEKRTCNYVTIVTIVFYFLFYYVQYRGF